MGPLLFLIYINDFKNSSSFFDFHLFADDSNLFCQHKDISELEKIADSELKNVQTWLCTNRLSLNIKKSNYVLFHPPQRKIEMSNFNLQIYDKPLQREFFIKYLGLMIDSHLNWKEHVNCIVKKIRRGIGILSKIRHYVSHETLLSIYYALLHPFLTYGLLAWGNTYGSTTNPVYILQKKAVRVMTFSCFDEHSSPLFKLLNIIKFPDLITYYIAIFMYKLDNHLLPSVFQLMFTKVGDIHNYKTRHATKQTYYLPKVRTNYGKFNIRFKGPLVWNEMDDNISSLSILQFKKNLRTNFIDSY